jgi:tetratricopeptide (TPR) repeat protein
MFFPRLRRRAKWVFAFLALAFALAFVVAGVGSGFGSGLGDYLADIFNTQPGVGNANVSEGRERALANPQDEEAVETYRESILQDTSLTTDEQIAEMNRFLELRPRDTDALQQLAGLYLTKAGEAESRAQAAQQAAASAFFVNEIQNPSGEFAQAVGPAPITDQIRNEASTTYAAAITEAQGLYGKEAEIWQRVATLQPEEATVFFELGRSSQQAGKTKEAISALERYLALAPEATDAQQIRALVKQLKQQQASQPAAPVAP